MTSRQLSTRRAASAVASALVLAAFALALCAYGTGARAQSGRNVPKPAPAPTPAPQGGSESESRPRPAKPPDVIVSFAVMEFDNNIIDIDRMARDGVLEAFVKRLGQSRAVMVKRAGKGGRREAREMAKKETDLHVILFELEEERAAMGDASIGRVDSRALLIKAHVYEAKTGNLKFVDTTFQRPHRETATVGRVRIPVPSRRVERYPSQLQLEQAARDSADHIMSRFHVTPPDE